MSSIKGVSAGDLFPTPPQRPSPAAEKGMEFEAMLLTQWLQSAETSFGSVPGADDDTDQGDEQMRSFGVQQLASALSRAGGVGISRLVTRALEASETSAAGSQVALSQIKANGHGQQ